MRYIYHYLAICRTARGNEVSIDGILDRSNPILTMEDYSESKAYIRKHLLEDEPGSIVILQSLAFLHTKEEN